MSILSLLHFYSHNNYCYIYVFITRDFVVTVKASNLQENFYKQMELFHFMPKVNREDWIESMISIH